MNSHYEEGAIDVDNIWVSEIIFKEICQFRAEEIAAAQNTERLKLKKEIAQLEIRLKHVPTHETYAVRTRPSAHGDH